MKQKRKSRCPNCGKPKGKTRILCPRCFKLAIKASAAASRNDLNVGGR